MGALPFPLLKNLSSIVPQNLRFFKGTSAFSGFSFQLFPEFSHFALFLCRKGGIPLRGHRPFKAFALQLCAALNGTGLGRDFYMFNFFEYKVAEALELFDSERRVIINCFNNIYTELQAPDDELTSHMLRLGIGQLLTCCRRFYDRQFDTKDLHSSDLGKRLDKMVDEYLSEGSKKLRTLGPPTVAWCAEQFHLTPSYFGDIVRREMGITPQAFLQTKLIDRAKSLLASQELTINEIAEELGFSYPNHFARLFRQKTGMSPSAFRRQLLKE